MHSHHHIHVCTRQVSLFFQRLQLLCTKPGARHKDNKDYRCAIRYGTSATSEKQQRSTPTLSKKQQKQELTIVKRRQVHCLFPQIVACGAWTSCKLLRVCKYRPGQDVPSAPSSWNAQTERENDKDERNTQFFIYWARHNRLLSCGKVPEVPFNKQDTCGARP